MSSKLIIKVYTYLKPEFEYITNVIFHEILGLDYQIIYDSNAENTIIELPNKKTLSFTNSFFKKYKNPKEYLLHTEIPQELINSKFLILNSDSGTQSIPIIYGKDILAINESHIECGLDLFASSYFMLTRWEEYVINEKDAHGRFPSKESLAVKNGFINRPIVNEYIEFLWHLLKKLDYKGERKKLAFEIIPTHDIDELFFWTSKNRLKLPFKLLKSFQKYAEFKTGELVNSFLKSLFDKTKDPYYQAVLNFINNNKKQAYLPIFFFIAGGNTKYEGFYAIKSRRTQNLLSHILEQGQSIGIHPSYLSSGKEDLFFAEIEQLNNSSQTKIKHSRQHYLRYHSPETFSELEKIGIKYDSSMYYSDAPGFRNGICHPFPIYDFINRKTLAIKEMPLIVMDTSLENKSKKESEIIISDLLNKVKTYNGQFVFLWHNSSTHWSHWKNVEELFGKYFYGG